MLSFTSFQIALETNWLNHKEKVSNGVHVTVNLKLTLDHLIGMVFEEPMLEA